MLGDVFWCTAKFCRKVSPCCFEQGWSRFLRYFNSYLSHYTASCPITLHIYRCANRKSHSLTVLLTAASALCPCSVSQTVSQSASQSDSQSDSQSASQSVRQPIRQTVSQTVRQPVSQTASQSDGQSDSQSVKRSVRQPVSHTFSQTASQSVRQSVRQSHHLYPFYGIRNSIAVFTITYISNSSWVILIQSVFWYPLSVRSVLFSSSWIYLGLR
jgi:hypothetical protein